MRNGPRSLIVASRVYHNGCRSAFFSDNTCSPITSCIFTGRGIGTLLLRCSSRHSNNFRPLTGISSSGVVILNLVAAGSPILRSGRAIVGEVRRTTGCIPLRELYLDPRYNFTSYRVNGGLARRRR